MYSSIPLPLSTHQHQFEGTPIVRTNYAEVGVECHYQKKHNVTSNALKPTWVPYAFTKVAEQQLVFSLRLMTDDWQFERSSSVYFLGHVMNIEASIIQDHHTTLRVYVDSCVATLALKWPLNLDIPSLRTMGV
ncbi:hypothetical protein J4Q44_G00044570 [Coregonus suidteri]|uniref:ZP domain-containing protein n=1 Tax=Coregonus suidteri TaxID=861788 RepID=A0AAN8R1N4_9TELE